jgi:HPt (histidine-containing phosphotransfer) domain-containing protein
MKIRFRLHKLLASLFPPVNHAPPPQESLPSQQGFQVAADAPRPDKVLDPARMQDLLTNLGDGLQDVIESYLDDTPRQIQKLQQAYEEGDWAALQRTAHSLKSSSGIFGATKLVALCRSLEMMPETQRQAVPELIHAISSEYEPVRGMLNLYRTQGNTPA